MNQLDELLKQHYAHGDKSELNAQIDQWLAEDLTAEYDSIVAQRPSTAQQPHPIRRSLVFWLSMAASIVLLIGVAVWQWPGKEQTNQSIVKIEKKVPVTIEVASPSIPSPSEVAEKPKKEKILRKGCSERKPSPDSNLMATNTAETETVSASAASSDSLDYYLARLEKSLDEIDDSLYQERAEQIIRADVRLQRLVKRIYMDDIERQRQRQHAMYLHY